ncbi:MAG TPA: NAD-dependent epimerase/dehydratase family protein [Chitinophagales bacterium]|nr:NAD-dependent epimerase/dehydratase family protein [Chitinophagales bacterium]
MKYHLVSGGCGFVGRNIVKRILNTTNDCIIIVDDLSVGTLPSTWDWLQPYVSKPLKDAQLIGNQERILFFRQDFREFLRNLMRQPLFLKKEYGINAEKFSDVFHFAAIVGGRAKIDGDPMLVALDLSIDAEFFYWVVRHQPERVLYPSSSAAYPIGLQGETDAMALKETDIDFTGNLGKPDMTYGWSKLTGEYLGRIAAQYYGISVASVRPFSGYGEDQDLTYPVPAIAARAARKDDPFEVWGSGRQGRDFVHIDDCVDAIFMALDKIKDGTAINIGSGKLTTFIELIELFCKFAGYQPVIKPLLDKPVGVSKRYADMNYVKNTFGWRPKVSLEEGMRRVYDKAVENMKK